MIIEIISEVRWLTTRNGRLCRQSSLQHDLYMLVQSWTSAHCRVLLVHYSPRRSSFNTRWRKRSTSARKRNVTRRWPSGGVRSLQVQQPVVSTQLGALHNLRTQASPNCALWVMKEPEPFRQQLREQNPVEHPGIKVYAMVLRLVASDWLEFELKLIICDN